MKFKTIILSIAMFSLVFAGTAFARGDYDGRRGHHGPKKAPDQVVDVQAGVTIDNSGQTSISRGFPIGHDIALPGFAAHFDKATPDHRFIPLQNLFLFQNSYSGEEAANILKTAEGDMDLSIRSLVPVTDETEPAGAVTVATLAQVEKDGKTYVKLPGTLGEANRVQLAMGTVAADGVDAISVDLLAAIVDDACKRGATHVIFLGEGVNRVIRSFSWGIGISTSYAHLDDENNDGTLTTGGLGISGGEAGYKHLPWLQFVMVKVQ